MYSLENSLDTGDALGLRIGQIELALSVVGVKKWVDAQVGAGGRGEEKEAFATGQLDVEVGIAIVVARCDRPRGPHPHVDRRDGRTEALHT